MIIFHTKNLNERLYRRMIENVLLQLKVKNVGKFLQEWSIHIHPLSATREEFFRFLKTTAGQTINPNMPSGVTGQHEMLLFLHDTKRITPENRENSDRVQHELCHAVLFGTRHFVSGVHDLINQSGQVQKSFVIEFWYRHHLIFWSKFRIRIIDIRDLL